MSVPVPSTPTNPADLRSPLAAFLAGWLWGESDGHLPESEFAGRAGRLADELHEQVVAPVLEGLHAELDRTRARKQTDLDALKERCGRQLATINAHIRRRDQLRADIERITRACAALIVDANKERESRIAWACEADRLQQERNALSSLLRGMARRVGDFRRELTELAAELPCGWCNGTGIAPEETFGRDGDGAPMVDGDQPCPEGCRPSVSDQTPATPANSGEEDREHIADDIESFARVLTQRFMKEFPGYGFHSPTLEKLNDLREWAAEARKGHNAAPSSVQGDTTPKEA